MKKIALLSIVGAVWLWIDGAALSCGIAMTFSYVNHHYPGVTEFRFIYADGPIAPGTANQFLAFVREKNIGPGAIVLFNSPGGNVAEALEIGRAIRSAKFDTSIGIQGQVFQGECYSACTLSFLGGLRRTVPSQAPFGVHRVSGPASLSATQALDLGQITLGQIVEYTAYMGVRPEFVTELTRASPDEINLLSQSRLKELRVISPDFETAWEIKAYNGGFYLLGTTTSNDNGVEKIIFVCDPSRHQMDAMMLFNATGEYQQNALKWTNSYELEFDGEEVELKPDEILKPVERSGDNYVSTTVRLSPRIIDRLSHTSELAFKMVPRSKQIFQGWTSDFASGRAKFAEFQKTCH